MQQKQKEKTDDLSGKQPTQPTKSAPLQPPSQSAEDMDRHLELWSSLMDKAFSVSLLDKLDHLCLLPKELRERITFTYESYLGNGRNALRRKLKELAEKHRLHKVFADAHEVLDFNLLIAGLGQQGTDCTDEELYIRWFVIPRGRLRIPYTEMEQETFLEKVNEMELAKVEAARTKEFDDKAYWSSEILV